jgi:hypothetical protein
MVLLPDVITSKYLHKEQITNSCWSERPSLRQTYARQKNNDLQTNSLASHNMGPDQMVHVPAVYSHCIKDTPQQASYLHHTL